MTPIIAFVRAFPQTRQTLCCEVVAAWLSAHGLMQAIPRRAQIVMQGRLGAERGAQAIAARIGARTILPSTACAGDIVLVPCVAGNRVLGLHLGEGMSVLAGFGTVHIGRFVVERAWRVPA